MKIGELPFGTHQDIRGRLTGASEALRTLIKIMDEPNATDNVSMLTGNIASIRELLGDAARRLVLAEQAGDVPRA
jgi:hypothetical protein